MAILRISYNLVILTFHFTNNSNVPIDIIIFTFYSDQLTIDVETGIVTNFFFIILLLDLLQYNNIICF